MLLERGGDVGEDLEVVLHLLAHVRALHFDHHFAAVAQHGAMDLPQRRRGHRRRLEGLEGARDAHAQLLLHDLLDLGERERLDLVLQRLQRGNVLRRHDVRTGGEHLPELDVGRPHFLEAVRERLRAALHVRLDLAFALVRGEKDLVGLERQAKVLPPVAGEEHEQVFVRADVAGLEHRAA